MRNGFEFLLMNLFNTTIAITIITTKQCKGLAIFLNINN